MKNPLLEYRLSKEMTQQELADRAHVSKGAVSNLEAGSSAPSLPILQKIAKVLGYDSAGTLIVLADTGEMPKPGQPPPNPITAPRAEPMAISTTASSTACHTSGPCGGDAAAAHEVADARGREDAQDL